MHFYEEKDKIIKSIMKIKVLIAGLVFMSGSVLVIDIVRPGTLVQIRKLPFISPLAEKVDVLTKKTEEKVEKILGKTNNRDELEEENIKREVTEKIKGISSQLVESEAGRQVKNEVEEVINQAAEQIQDLPEEQMKKVKQEVKRQVCEELLKEF